MDIRIRIPDKNGVLKNSCTVKVARKGETWSEVCLGVLRKERGVYIIHQAGVIKYVGKTSGPSMSFAMRLRREFQESAAMGKHVYEKLNGEIQVALIPVGEIRDCLANLNSKGMASMMYI